MRSLLPLLAFGLALVFAGCQRAPEKPTSAPLAAVTDLEQAKKALAVANWAGAVPHLRAALRKDPDSLFIHYNLAICATWLDKQDEAVREFQWVLDHASSDSDEATTARKWLAKKGKSVEISEVVHNNPFVGDSGLHGVVMWGQPPVLQNRMQLLLIGLPDSPTKDVRFVLRTDQDGHYEFKRIPAGSYKLEVLLEMKPRWRLKVAVEPGQDVAVDLTPENSFPARNDFPLAK